MAGLASYVERESLAFQLAATASHPSSPSLSLSHLSTEQVLMITQDGRVITGQLKGFDSLGSVILAGSVERIFSTEEGVEEVPLGLYVVRGDSM